MTSSMTSSIQLYQLQSPLPPPQPKVDGVWREATRGGQHVDTPTLGLGGGGRGASQMYHAVPIVYHASLSSLHGCGHFLSGHRSTLFPDVGVHETV